MGNIITKKELEKKASSKSNDVPALSNVSGVPPPPKFTSKVDVKRNGNNWFGSVISRQSQIDTLPRHTGGSFELFKAIESNQKNAKINVDSDVDSTILLRDRFQDNPKNSENIEKKKTKNLVNGTKKSTNNKANTQLKNHEKHKYRYDSSSSTESLDNLKKIENIISSQNKKIENESPEKVTNKTVEKLNQTREKLNSNIASLSEIEDKQRSKILEQERQLEIQNMKIKDALIIHKSLSNFNQLSDDYESFNEHPHYARHNQLKSNTFIKKPKYNRQRLPLSSVQFPTILTKYEPSINRIYSRYPNMSYYRPENEEKVGLYLEKSEDIVDSKGRILSSNQSFKYLGEADAKTASIIERNSKTEFTQPNVKTYKQHHEILMNNHKYEIIKNESVSTLTNAELEEIIKIIEKTEKFENRDTSTYFVNGNLIKRTPIEQQIETTKRKDPPKIIVTKHDEDLKPSFTVSENLYKMYLNKKGEKQNFNTISKAAGLNEKKDEARIKNYCQDFRNTVNVQALKDNFKNFKSSKEFGLNTKL
jgi:hypothetical protein